jgi:hypothetical protein
LDVYNLSSIDFELNKKDLINIDEGKNLLNQYNDILFIPYEFKGKFKLNSKNKIKINMVLLEVHSNNIILNFISDNFIKIELEINSI